MDLWNESNSHLQQLKDFVPRGAMLVSVELRLCFWVFTFLTNGPIIIYRSGTSVSACVSALVRGVKGAPCHSFYFWGCAGILNKVATPVFVSSVDLGNLLSNNLSESMCEQVCSRCCVVCCGVLCHPHPRPCCKLDISLCAFVVFCFIVCVDRVCRFVPRAPPLPPL